jgi:hypothetical protein
MNDEQNGNDLRQRNWNNFRFPLETGYLEGKELKKKPIEDKTVIYWISEHNKIVDEIEYYFKITQKIIEDAAFLAGQETERERVREIVKTLKQTNETQLSEDHIYDEALDDLLSAIEPKS